VTINRVVGRGFGPSRGLAGRAGPVSRGFGGFSFFVAPIERPIRLKLGQSGFKRRMQELDEVIVWAKCMTVNDVEPTRPIKGWIRVKIDRDNAWASVMAEQVATRVRLAWETFKVTVTRLK
jgi:hypothetical protein